MRAIFRQVPKERILRMPVRTKTKTRKHDAGRAQKSKKSSWVKNVTLSSAPASYDQANTEAHQIKEHSPSLEKTVNELHEESRKMALEEVHSSTPTSERDKS